MTSMDKGYFSDKYYDYESDEIAREQERQLVSGLASTDLWCDPTFVCHGSALYFDPFHPPRGSLPADLLQWNRLCLHDVRKCGHPILYKQTPSSGDIIQGAIDNKWMLHAFSALASNPGMLTRVLVSGEHHAFGIYTFKFYKQGKWRYVHVDDRIACMHTGQPCYSRNADLDETWVMLLEKAYAKLHGCYQALVCGDTKDALHDLTGAGVVLLNPAECDLWDTVISALERNALIALKNSCETARATLDGIVQGAPVRWLASMLRTLITDNVYICTDARICESESTEMCDALHVKLIKLRNPCGKGIWRGDWNRDDPKWLRYPQIMCAVRRPRPSGAHATCHPTDEPRARDDSEAVEAERSHDELLEEFNPKSGAAKDCCGAEGSRFFWMDFDSLARYFNEMILLFDISDSHSLSSKRYFGEWEPGERLNGGGGPPSVQSATLWSQNPMFPIVVNETGTVIVTLSQKADHRWQRGYYKSGEGEHGNAERKRDDTNNTSSALPGQEPYYISLGWALVLLTGHNVRVSKFHSSKMVGHSSNLGNTRSVAGWTTVLPGRYAIVPFTFEPVTWKMEFVLDIVGDKSLDFEMSEMYLNPSMDESSDEDDTEDYGASRPSRRVTHAGITLPFRDLLTASPTVHPADEPKSAEMLGIRALYEQVGDLARQVRMLRQQVQHCKENAH